jgi:hypothetical protein
MGLERTRNKLERCSIILALENFGYGHPGVIDMCVCLCVCAAGGGGLCVPLGEHVVKEKTVITRPTK